MVIILMAIGWYYIDGYWWVLVLTNGYSISGY